MNANNTTNNTTNDTTNNAQLIDNHTIDTFIDATLRVNNTFAIVDVQTSFTFTTNDAHNVDCETLCNMLISTL